MLSIKAVKQIFNTYKSKEGCLVFFCVRHSLDYKRLKKFLNTLPDTDAVMNKQQFFQFFDIALTVNVGGRENESERKLFFDLQQALSDEQRSGIWAFVGIKECAEKNKVFFPHYNADMVFALMQSHNSFNFVMHGLQDLDILETVISELCQNENLEVDKQPIQDAFQYLIENPNCDYKKLASETRDKIRDNVTVAQPKHVASSVCKV